MTPNSAPGTYDPVAKAGHRIKILCLTNGTQGTTLCRNELAARRLESTQAADLVGAELNLAGRRWSLTPSIELKKTHRRNTDFAPNVIVTIARRTITRSSRCRAAVKTVLTCCRFRLLRRTMLHCLMPSIVLTYDRFQDRGHFASTGLSIQGLVQDDVIELLSCHASQVFDWLPSFTRCQRSIRHRVAQTVLSAQACQGGRNIPDLKPGQRLR